MTEKWLTLAEAIELIEVHLHVSTGPAQVALIKACGSGEIRAIERNPEHGKEGVDWWDLDIPASDWRAPDAHVISATGEACLQGNTYGSRILTRDDGQDEGGYVVLQAWSAKVLISDYDLRGWLKLSSTIGHKPKGRRPTIRNQAEAALQKLRKKGVDLDKEKDSTVFDLARGVGYKGSERTLARAYERK
jgi:hypothetical protein